MHLIYNLLTHITSFVLVLIGFFNKKIHRFVQGRKTTFDSLKNSLVDTDKVIWVHAASLGEYEQGLPILERMKNTYPKSKILLTFFSPSGYDVKKNTPAADVVTYLPLDTIANAKKFVSYVRPQLVIFIKYEIWPNYLKALQKEKIPTLLISSLFRKQQSFFKWYGSFMRKSLSTFSHFFVQDQGSIDLLKTIGYTNVSLSGDTRFDRVSEILKQDNKLSFMDRFKRDHFCFVAGSTWPEDEAILTSFINQTNEVLKFVIAPHNINETHCKALQQSISKKVIRYSQIDSNTVLDYDVLILDTIGILTKVYSYATVAYVGGGFATGLHNTLEPAVFGIPVIIGPKFDTFKEARDLVAQNGVLPIANHAEFHKIITQCIASVGFREKTGEINHNYILKNTGASIQIMEHICTLL